MTFEEREIATNNFFDKCKHVLNSKGKDYTFNNEAFGELKDTAKDLGISPEKVLWVYAKKHYSAIKNYVHSGKLESEPIEMRIVDFANYMALLFALIQEKEEDPK